MSSKLVEALQHLQLYCNDSGWRYSIRLFRPETNEVCTYTYDGSIITCSVEDSSFLNKRALVITSTMIEYKRVSDNPARPEVAMYGNSENAEQHWNKREFLVCAAAHLLEAQIRLLLAMVKEIITFMEPDKRSTHPFKGGESTRPVWWPDGVKHMKIERLNIKVLRKFILHFIYRGTVPASVYRTVYNYASIRHNYHAKQVLRWIVTLIEKLRPASGSIPANLSIRRLLEMEELIATYDSSISVDIIKRILISAAVSEENRVRDSV
ncbi:hypothetical protein CANCADRAFT_43537 [Tortispora caseinolytica NRRL Y-17796]|uniref:Subtelomeric hrmA-associated cluster protein AFUB-079030/YDR124W-like helical bundle domain-containing protein n=1 Tax=Tortispora caseinolytica NRRL Y-17796 TaxID=767744 RepID=A0A1E4TMI8_9ASCO|nr:hypothetical protein CANCADRAFT_43537 [Tortispora caseinolytica NRRL Y-17796]